jgi:hypothetical protein
MSAKQNQLSDSSAGFAMAGAIVVVFNTVLAWVKDAYAPLLQFMNALAWHNWITQGLADIILFVGLGLILSKMKLGERMGPNGPTTVLVAAVVVAGLGLFAWYAVF